MAAKLTWQGHILAVQPRIRLYRSFPSTSSGQAMNGARAAWAIYCR
ncbi:MAG: hypothetical protein KJZ86_01875 [Caldilineaceae bacterium]|nr:hypothetical protein [Caldilineaceae bacterium]HRJ40295.1 hypothetical protein [Caldilineaceae bacterium]